MSARLSDKIVLGTGRKSSRKWIESGTITVPDFRRSGKLRRKRSILSINREKGKLLTKLQILDGFSRKYSNVCRYFSRIYRASYM